MSDKIRVIIKPKTKATITIKKKKIPVKVTVKSQINWNTIQQRAGKKGLNTGLKGKELSALWKSRPTSWNEVDNYLIAKSKVLAEALQNAISAEDASERFDSVYIETGLTPKFSELQFRNKEEEQMIINFFSDMLLGETRTFLLYDLVSGYQSSLTPLEIIQIFIDNILIMGENYLVSVGDKWLPLNTRNIMEWEGAILKLLEKGDEGISDSYTQNLATFNVATSIIIKKVRSYGKKKGEREETNAGFFPYWNNSDINLEKQQILSKDSKNKKILYDNCFIYSLIQSGLLDKGEIESIKIFCRTRSISGKKIGEIAKKFNFSINQLRRDKRNKPERWTLNKGQKRVINIGKIEKHFFFNETIDGEEVFFIIERLLKEKQFEPMKLRDTIKYTSEYYNNRDNEIGELTMKKPFIGKDEKTVYVDYKPVIDEEGYVPKVCEASSIWCADFEAYFQKTESVDDKYRYKQLPILLVAENITDSQNFECFQPTDSDISAWFDLLIAGGDALVYFHNLGYDITQLIHILPKYAYIKKFLPAGSSVFSVEIAWKKCTITFKCSYKLTTQSIANLAKSYLGSEIKKEMSPYELFNSETKDKEWIDIQMVKDYYGKKKYEKFLECASDYIDQELGRFYLHRFNLFYCRRDVEILKKSLLKFREMVSEYFGLDAFAYLTAASLADGYFKKEGCYDNVMSFSGIPLIFMQKAVVGGRCMTSENKPQHEKGKILDMDCNSLYPTAMSRIGFPVGIPVHWNEPTFDFDDLQMIAKYYIVEIEIIDIAIPRKFPLLSSKNKDGIRMFSNDVRGRIVIDKYALEDAIKYQGLEFKIIRGYFWENMNYKIQSVIKKVYTERQKFKAEGNPVQEVFKLIMNSAYGKTIERPHEKSSKIVLEDEVDKIINNNMENISMIVPIAETGKVLLTEYSKTLNHFNRVQCGAGILSMSKRVMNEVMCPAEDMGLKMFYQDTDSIHILQDDWIKLKNKLGDIQGKSLGQFSTDYKGECIGSEGYYLAKKLYGVKFNIPDKDGHTHHLRAKGIPNKLMQWGDYELLHSGQTIKKNILEASPGIRTTHLQARIIKDFQRTIKLSG